MADDNPVAAEMRLYALELMLTSFLAAAHLQSGDALRSLTETRQKFIEKTRRNPLPGLNPAMSDLASAELEEAFERLHQMQAGFLDVSLPEY